jgi:CubicO group peptidase (beta-lactamase class C family)
VEQNRLSLDSDVNEKLRSWKLPENEFTQEKKVTLRGILSHSAGLTIHGFPGYTAKNPLPSLVQVLDGMHPANTGAVRVEKLPGLEEQYSGGGYAVMQQLIVDVTEEPFSTFMHETVLKPFDMTDSTFEQALPAHLTFKTAVGHDTNGHATTDRWHIYP